MIPNIQTDEQAQEAIRNLADLSSLKTLHHDQACQDILLGLVIYFRRRVLDRQQADQEALWSQSQGGQVSWTLLLCIGLSAMAIAASLGYFWPSIWLGGVIALLAWLALRDFREEDRSEGSPDKTNYNNQVPPVRGKGE